MILLNTEEKLYKREVYSFLSLVSDIGGLRDGLLIVVGFLLASYNVSMYELFLVKTFFRFQKRMANSSQNIKKVSKTDLIRISQHIERQQILELPACLNLASKVLCKALFKSDHQSKLKKLERAK
jgi:hypothetical protein